MGGPYLCLVQCEDCGRFNVEAICGQPPEHPSCEDCQEAADA